MGGEREPVSQAVRAMRAEGVAFEGHPYADVDGGGTGELARQAGVDEHLVVKTLVMEDDEGPPLVVLMHGDRGVSTRTLARHLGVRTVRPCRP